MPKNRRSFGGCDMPLAGTLVNVTAIVAGGLLGLMFRKGLPQKYMDAVMRALGLVVFGAEHLLSSAAGRCWPSSSASILRHASGHPLRLDERLKRLGDAMQSRIALDGGRLPKPL